MTLETTFSASSILYNYNVLFGNFVVYQKIK